MKPIFRSALRLILGCFSVVPFFSTSSSLAGSGSSVATVATVVWRAHSEQAIAAFQSRPHVVKSMVDCLVKEVTGQGDLTAAWRSLIKPGEKVGIKVAAAGGPLFSSHQEIVEAVVEGLEKAGIPRGDVVVWDRADLEAAGFSSKMGYHLGEVQPGTGYDAKAVENFPLIGRLIWGDSSFSKSSQISPTTLSRAQEQLSTESYWSSILTRRVTKIINIPVMSNEENCGLAGALYNVTIPNLDNWRRFVQAPGRGNPYLPELYVRGEFASKVVLHIMDGLIAQYAGGPGFQPQYAFHHKTLYASKDPVALDAIAFRAICQWRSEAGLPLPQGAGSYLETAQAIGLGSFSPSRIEVRDCAAAQP